MKNAINFDHHLYKDLTGSLFTAHYMQLNTCVDLFSDNIRFIEIANERLMLHFPYNPEVKRDNKRIQVYSLSADKLSQFIKGLSPNRESLEWKQNLHMGGYYFNVGLSDGITLTAWVTNRHNQFGNSYFSINKLIADFLNGDPNTCILVDLSRNCFIYLYNHVNTYTTLVPMRLIRSLMMRPLLKNDCFYFHAAAIRYYNKAFLFTGNSGSGKTSTVLHFMNNKQGELIANDKVFIGVESHDEVKVYGWPTVVSLGVGNLNQYDQLRKYLVEIDDVTCSQDLFGYAPKKEYLELTQDQLKALKKEGNKLVISHMHLSSLFNKKIIPYAKINAIININLEWNYHEKSLRKLSIDEKLHILNNNRINNVSDQLCWIGYPLLPEREIDCSVVKKILESVDFYEYKADFRDPGLTDFLDNLAKA